MSWRRLREVLSTGWPPGGPREKSGLNLASFWMDLGDIFGALGIFVEGFYDILRETVNDKQKPGHKNSTNRERTTSAATSERTTTSERAVKEGIPRIHVQVQKSKNLRNPSLEIQTRKPIKSKNSMESNSRILRNPTTEIQELQFQKSKNSKPRSTRNPRNSSQEIQEIHDSRQEIQAQMSSNSKPRNPRNLGPDN